MQSITAKERPSPLPYRKLLTHP